MPKLDGIKATIKIREEKNIPIILVSAKSEDTDKIIGLNIGADDYITKPFNLLELIARVKSNLRRYVTLGNYDNNFNKDILKSGGLELNISTKEVKVDGEVVKITPIEFKILKLLLSNKGRVFSIDEIYEKVWNEESFNVENTVAVHIRRIREKIEINPKEPRYLKVVWGVGYKIEKNYNGKILKNKSFIINFIFILTMFMITQVLGVMICLKLINTNITVTIGIIGTLNFLLCKVLLFN